MYLLDHSDQLAEWNQYLRAEVARLKGERMNQEEFQPEGIRPNVDGPTGIAYSHDTRIINDALAHPVWGGSIFRYRWERRGSHKTGICTVWVLGNISHMLDLFRSWEKQGDYLYTYVGEGVV